MHQAFAITLKMKKNSPFPNNYHFAKIVLLQSYTPKKKKTGNKKTLCRNCWANLSLLIESLIFQLISKSPSEHETINKRSYYALHIKWSFPLRISSVNVTKSLMKNFIFCTVIIPMIRRNIYFCAFLVQIKTDTTIIGIIEFKFSFCYTKR